MKFLSANQQIKAKKARKLMQALATPTAAELKAMLRMNLTKNCEVKTDNVNLAKRVCGPDLGAVKEKSMRVKPAPVTSDLVEMPDELLKV